MSIDPRQLRPLGGRVLIRFDRERTDAMRTRLVLPDRVRTANWFIAEVISVAKGIDVEPGSLVVVEAQSAKVGETFQWANDDGARHVYSFVPCRALPEPRSTERLMRVEKRIREIETVLLPAADHDAAETLQRERENLKVESMQLQDELTRCRRANLGLPLGRNPGSAEGVLAVLE